MGEVENRESTILIVDDMPESIQLLAGLLNREGYRVIAATGGAWAVSAIRKSRPDLILLDVLMKGMDGYETLRWIRSEEMGRDIPVLFLSGLAEREDIVKGYEAGAVDFIKKPFQTYDLLLRIRTHLNLAAQKRRLELLMGENQFRLQRLIEELCVPLNAIDAAAELSGNDATASRELIEVARSRIFQCMDTVRSAVERLEPESAAGPGRLPKAI